MKFSIQTFGCKVSQYESQAIREAWHNMYPQAQEVEPHQADILLIASCAVTREGVTDARQLCNKWRKLYPNAHIIVTGCAAEVAKNDFEKADAIIPQKRRDILVQENPYSLKGYYEVEKNLSFPAFSINDFKRSRPVIKVQDGCSHLCSYCIVPYCRGASRSRPLENIILEIDRLLTKGFREFVLSGVNLRQYSHDNLDFWDVLNVLQEKFAPNWEHKARFRLSSLEPAQLNTKGIETLTRSAMIAPHLHLSLQSGSQTVLERMRREHYLLSDIDTALNALSKKWPLFGLGADFLLGFPQESDTEFQETINFIENIPLSYAHVFPYSIRPNTLAAQYSGQIEKHIKKERTALVRARIEEKQKKFLDSIIQEKELLLSLDVPENTEKLSQVEGLDQYYNNYTVNIHNKSIDLNHEFIRIKNLQRENNKISAEIV